MLTRHRWWLSALVGVLTMNGSAFAQFVVEPTLHFSADAVAATGNIVTAVTTERTYIKNVAFDTLVFARSTDGGMSWVTHKSNIRMQPSELWAVPNSLVQVDQNTVYTVGWSQNDLGQIASTIDGGNTWDIDSSIRAKLWDISMLPSGEAMILAQRPPKIILRADVGWHVTRFAPMAGTPEGWAVGHTYGAGEYRVFCSKGTASTADHLDVLYWTEDNFLSVDSSIIPFTFTDSLPTYDVECVFGRGGVVLASAYTISSNGAGNVCLCRSSNGGRTWSTQIFDGSRSPAPHYFISRGGSDTILAHDAVSRNLLDYSTDAGVTWNVDTVILANGGGGPVSISVAAPLPDGSFAAGYSTTVAPYLFLGRLQLPENAAVASRQTAQAPLMLVYLANSLIRVEGKVRVARVMDVLGRSVDVMWHGNEANVKELAPGLYYVVDAMGRTARFIR